MGYNFFLQGIFPNQGSNPHFLHWQVGSLPLSHQGSPYIIETKRCNIGVPETECGIKKKKKKKIYIYIYIHIKYICVCKK